MPEFDVFLSHNSKDKPAVRELGEALRDRGLQVWLDEWELPPGRPWQDELEKCIKTVRCAAVLVGKDGLGPWELPEVRVCLSQFVNRGLRVIPVLLPDASREPELPLFLHEFTWVDLRGGLTENGLDRLEWGITGNKPKRLASTREAEAVLESAAVPAAPSPPWRSRWAVAVLCLAIVAGVAGGWQWWHRPAIDPLTYELPTELVALGSLPSKPATKDLYLKGREALGKFDATKARDLLKSAIAAEPGFPLSHSALAEAWHRLGYSTRADEEAKRAYDLSDGLPAGERELVRTRYWETIGRWDRVVESYRTLRSAAPTNLDYGLGLARALTHVGRAQEALEIAESLQRATDDPRVDLAEAEASFPLSEFDRQRNAALRARAKAEKLGIRSLTARALLLEAQACRSQQNYSGALTALQRAQDIYIDSGDLRNLALTTSTKAAVFYDQGKLEDAREGFSDALDSYRKVEDLGGEATQINNLAGVLSSGGHYAEAIRMYEQAAKLLREVGDWDGEAEAIGNLGYALGLQGDFDAGVQRIEEARKSFHSMGNRQGEATQLLNLATLYQNRGDLVRVRSFYERALKLVELTGNQSLTALISANLGRVLTTQGDLDGAYEKLQSAVETQTNLHEKEQAASSHLALAEVLLEQSLPSQGIPFAERAAVACHDTGDANCEAEAVALLARLRTDSGDLQQARTDLGRAEQLGSKVADPWLTANVALAAGPILAAEGKTAEAVKRLKVAIEKSQKAGVVDLDLYLRLALGEIEATQGNRQAGRELLEAVKKEARANGMGLIAKKAARALSKAT